MVTKIAEAKEKIDSGREDSWPKEILDIRSSPCWACEASQVLQLARQAVRQAVRSLPDMSADSYLLIIAYNLQDKMDIQDGRIQIPRWTADGKEKKVYINWDIYVLFNFVDKRNSPTISHAIETRHRQ